ncbi:glycosyl hydrolase family 28-related protein [Rhodoplanes azumiensis]|uniref:Glycosyl hydrolase family 28-related protein n=1 Tax=Rhodoplanes azumiensis TaxID=1897628 RepID=A0ABW5AP79_9BRAD
MPKTGRTTRLTAERNVVTRRRWTTIAVLLAATVRSAAAAADPVVFWHNDPVGPDDAVLVSGADLDVVTAARIARIDDAGHVGNATALELLQRTPGSFKFVVPAAFAAGLYRVTLTHAGGEVTIRLNAPVVYWLQAEGGDTVAPGGWLRVFGRDIVRRSERARLRLVPEAAGPPVELAPAQGDLWSARFVVPDAIRAGAYKVEIFNGEGAARDVVEAGRVTVRPRAEAGGRTYDVRAYGAVGDASRDSTRAIASALETAGRDGGGTVYLPRGRYLVSDRLEIPPGVTLAGERTDLVSLVWPDLATPPDALIKGFTRFGLRDLTVYASNHRHVVSGGFTGGDAAEPDSADIEIRRVRIRASAFFGHLRPDEAAARTARLAASFPGQLAPDTLRLSGRRIVVADCDILGTGRSLHLLGARDAVVTGNTLAAGRYGSYEIVGADRLIFEDNRVIGGDLQASGGSFNANAPTVTTSRNIFVSGNTFKGFYGHDREAVTSDAPGGYYLGAASTLAPDTLSLDGEPSDPALRNLPNPERLGVGAVVMVVEGRGTGASGRVARFERSGTPARLRVRLERPLPVALDATSVVTIVKAQSNYLVVGNSFEDTGPAVQSYGTGLDHVVAENRAVRTAGYLVTGLYYHHMQPGWRVQVLDNRILEGNVYRAIHERSDLAFEAAIAVQGLQPSNAPGRPPLVQGVIVRGNRLDEDAHIAVRGYVAASPGVRDVIVEGNTIGASRDGLVVDVGVAGALVRRNTVRRIPR